MADLAAAMVREGSRQRGAREAAADGWDGPPAAHLARWMPGSGSADHSAWVATLDGRVRGFALAHVESWGAGRRGILDACFVEQGARGNGVGKLLLAACVSWLEAEGSGGIDGIALPGDRAAKNFYEAAGFKARQLVMYRPLA